MPACSYDMTLPNQLDAATDDAYANTIHSVQDLVASHASAQQKLIDETKRLELRNAQLTRQHEHLQQERSRLLAQLQQSRGPPAAAQEPQDDGLFKFVRSYSMNGMPVHSVAMNHDNDMFATASWDGTVKLVKPHEEADVRTLGQEAGTMAGLYAVAFSKPLGESDRKNILGCASCDKFVYLWDYESGVLRTKLEGHTNEVNCIDFHETQYVLASASDDKKCIIWDYQEGLELRKLDNHQKEVYGARFLGVEYQYLVATCSFDRSTRVFDMRSKTVVTQFRSHEDDVIGIDYVKQKNWLVTGSDDGLIVGYDLRKMSERFQINTITDSGKAENEVKRIAVSPNGNWLAAGTSSNTVIVYDLRPNAPTLCATLQGHSDCVFDVTWGVNPRTGQHVVVSASHDHTSRCWRQVADGF